MERRVNACPEILPFGMSWSSGGRSQDENPFAFSEDTSSLVTLNADRNLAWG